MGLKLYSQCLNFVLEKEQELFEQTGEKKKRLLVRVYICPSADCKVWLHSLQKSFCELHITRRMSVSHIVHVGTESCNANISLLAPLMESGSSAPSVSHGESQNWGWGSEEPKNGPRQESDILSCSASWVPGTRLCSSLTRDLNPPGICTLSLDTEQGFLSFSHCLCRERGMIWMAAAAAAHLSNSFVITGVGGEKPSRIINSFKFPLLSLQLPLKKVPSFWAWCSWAMSTFSGGVVSQWQ